MNLLIAMFVGALAGLHISTWGMYKDAPHEGFTWPKYFRSCVVGAVLGLAAGSVLKWDLTQPASTLVFWGLIYVLERSATEFWKTFIRDEDQSKYFIPMQFGVFGKPIKNNRRRISIGFLIAAVVVGLFAGILLLERSSPGWSRWTMVLALGSLGGWIAAFGGAWKDAPIEGFETFKFFRSPIVATLYAMLVAHFTESLLVIPLSALGFTVATIETYKTFFFPHKPRGKFAGKPILFPEMLQRRRKFAVLYAMIWLAVVTCAVAAFLGPHYPLVL